jgi:predicted transcriptional regulator with HTH domain
MEDKITKSKDINIDNAIRSFHSEERRRVYLYLTLTYPAWATAAEIAGNVRSDHANVVGALKGDGKRYSKKLALVKVGIVECKKETLGNYRKYMFRAKRKGSRAFIQDKQSY